MLALVSTRKWYRSVNEDIPILLLAGKEDPIGNGGKGILEVHRQLEDTRHWVELHYMKGCVIIFVMKCEEMKYIQICFSG